MEHVDDVVDAGAGGEEIEAQDGLGRAQVRADRVAVDAQGAGW
ncbi:hypothetical protein OOK39_40635 [Streptomyces sp. NBC_00264]|nr:MULTISPECIES: hypothetical protein [unclassified Streptomyces]WSG55595.1 hypothetical protein OHA38_40880 [Streptomyces sp. NBC_01732]WSX06733.1 hypothetical protein OG355_43755 [Streptomyces sp. NBC_00987]MCX4391362.1 hypothetical protein [Streptomyces sp. NBC_01767]MCX5165444.1 hypothetical protein [Streptomyces sp. NBC_00305]MCX5223968.1 hypothetical protein [Streptomyces sp. NBC_00264]